MPYYRDIRVEIDYPLGSNLTNVAPSARTSLTSGQVTTSFRSRPKDENSVLILDSTADPYAYFLADDRKRMYAAALKARGMDAKVEPDRGHTFESYSYRRESTQGSFTIVDNSGRTTLSAVRMPVFVPPNDAFVNAFGMYTYPGTAAARYSYGSELQNFAQRAIVKTRPKLASFSLAAFLGELREGLPTLLPKLLTLRSRAEVARKAGGDYLNVVFGWMPLLADLQEIANILLNATEILSGRPVEGAPVRRTWELPKETSSFTGTPSGQPQAQAAGVVTNSQTSSGLGYWLNPLLGGGTAFNAQVPFPGETHLGKTLARRRWFVGSYMPFYPLGFQPGSYIEQVGALFDLSITPEVLWQLSPWSWLIDWFTHVGDSLSSNLGEADGLGLIRYAYAMEQTEVKSYSYFQISSTTIGSGTSLRRYSGPRVHSVVDTWSWKRRIRANPYGFTVGGFSGLNPNQLAILGALGLAKL